MFRTPHTYQSLRFEKYNYVEYYKIYNSILEFDVKNTGKKFLWRRIFNNRHIFAFNETTPEFKKYYEFRQQATSANLRDFAIRRRWQFKRWLDNTIKYNQTTNLLDYFDYKRAKYLLTSELPSTFTRLRLRTPFTGRIRGVGLKLRVKYGGKNKYQNYRIMDKLVSNPVKTKFKVRNLLENYYQVIKPRRKKLFKYKWGRVDVKVNGLFLRLLNINNLHKIVNMRFCNILKWREWYRGGILNVGNFRAQLFWLENILDKEYFKNKEKTDIVDAENAKNHDIWLNNLWKWGEDSRRVARHLAGAEKQYGGGRYGDLAVDKQLRDLAEYDFEQAMPEDEGEIDYYNFYSELTGNTSNWEDTLSSRSIRELNIKRLEARWNDSAELTTEGSWRELSNTSNTDEEVLAAPKFTDYWAGPELGVDDEIGEMLRIWTPSSTEIFRNKWWETQSLVRTALDFGVSDFYGDVKDLMWKVNMDYWYDLERRPKKTYLNKKRLKKLWRGKRNKVRLEESNYDNSYGMYKDEWTLFSEYKAKNMVMSDQGSTADSRLTELTDRNLSKLTKVRRKNRGKLHGLVQHTYKSEIPIDGTDLATATNRLLENGWMGSRWNLGYLNNDGDLDDGFITDGSDSENFWTVTDPLDFTTVHPMFLESVSPDLGGVPWSTYSGKVEISYNSKETLQNDNSLRAILNMIPLFKDGNWSNSDTGQTSWGQNNLLSDTEIVKHIKSYNPVFGLYIINPERTKKDLSNMGEVYLELVSKEKILRKVSIFLTDEDTQFFDDKILSVHNLWLFWLEFTRHIFITRWRLTWDYTKKNNEQTSETNYQFPTPIIHELYWFKYLAYTRFIKNLTKNILFSPNNRIGVHSKKLINLGLFNILDEVYLVYTNNELTKQQQPELTTGVIKKKKTKIRILRQIN